MTTTINWSEFVTREGDGIEPVLTQLEANMLILLLSNLQEVPEFIIVYDYSDASVRDEIDEFISNLIGKLLP